MNWRIPNQLTALAGATLLLVMFPYSNTPVWACSTGGGSGGFSYGSQTGGGSVTVCARAAVETRTVAVAKPAPKPIAKPAPAPKPVAAPKPAPKPVTKPAPKPAPKILLTPAKLTPPPALLKPAPKPVPRIAPKSTPKPKAPVLKPVAKPPVNVPVVIRLSSSSAGQENFSPASITVVASPSQLALGEETFLAVDAMVHYRSGSILGRATDVRFEPIATSWNYGDGKTAGSFPWHSYAELGTYSVTATVAYSVSYQIAGESSWVSAGEIAVSDSAEVSVGDQGADPGGSVPDGAAPTSSVRLVAKNCIGNQSAYGCMH